MLASPHVTMGLSNLALPTVRADPYPFYARLRAQDPVHWDDETGLWVLTRYADIASVYNDTRFSRAEGLKRGFERLPQDERSAGEPVYHMLSKTVFYTDPPYHTHLRGLVNSAFTPGAVQRLRPFVQKVVDELLDAVEASRDFDAIRELAHPLPLLVIAQMLGLPSEQRELFKQWSDDLFAILGSVPHGPGLMEQAARSLAELSAEISAHIDDRRKQPQPDLLSGLIQAADGGQRLSQAELIANVIILLSAGHETTSHLIGNGLLALLRNPAQLEKLAAQPSLAASAVEEMMRYDNPVQISYRCATEDVELGQRSILQGQLVNSILAAGNRDPERFSEPDRFDIARDEGRHLGFGLGIHFCIGAPLVRLEAHVFFNSILRRFPGLRLTTDQLEWQAQPIFRGLKALPLSL